jgi:uncharacterized protein (TIGR03437 family)
LGFAQTRYDFVLPQATALVAPTNPQMPEGGIVNAATGLPGLAPGSLASAYGVSMAQAADEAGSWPLPRTLGVTSVSVNGVAAPLLFVSPMQVNFQIPWNLPTGDAQFKITVSGIESAPLTAPLSPAAPGIFVVTHGSDFTPVSAAAPATAGELLVVYATGLGPVDPATRDGEPASLEVLSSTTKPVAAKVNGQTAQVLFAGLAPGYAGLYQVNLQLPASLTAAGDVTLVLTAADVDSPAYRFPKR